jgi:hypothetical protein|eukprot:COSAG02_NODE_242_length_27511_cov_501.886364_15_plen_175_part_00
MANESLKNQKVGQPLPQWQALPEPPLAPMAGRWCSLEPLSLVGHGSDLFAAYRAPTPSGQCIWTYTGPDEGDPTVSREVFDAWIKSDVANPSRHIYAVVVVGGSNGVGRRAVGTCAHQAWEAAHGVIEIGHVYVSPVQQPADVARTLTNAVGVAISDCTIQLLWRCAPKLSGCN